MLSISTPFGDLSKTGGVTVEDNIVTGTVPTSSDTLFRKIFKCKFLLKAIYIEKGICRYQFIFIGNKVKKAFRCIPCYGLWHRWAE